MRCSFLPRSKGVVAVLVVSDGESGLPWERAGLLVADGAGSWFATGVFLLCHDDSPRIYSTIDRGSTRCPTPVPEMRTRPSRPYFTTVRVSFRLRRSAASLSVMPSGFVIDYTPIFFCSRAHR